MTPGSELERLALACVVTMLGLIALFLLLAAWV